MCYILHMTLDPVLLTLAADWCVNISAGWFAAAVITPAASDKPRYFNQWLVILNIVFALAFYGAAYIITTYVRDKP